MTSHKTLSLLGIAAALAGAIACSSPAPRGRQENTETVDENAKVERGRYLVGIMGCDDCHSPKVMGPMGPGTRHFAPPVRATHRYAAWPSDTNVFANGWVLMSMQLTTTHGPWGKTYAANLTSDETGIGNWSC